MLVEFRGLRFGQEFQRGKVVLAKALRGAAQRFIASSSQKFSGS
jgi:hypothetical protein